MAVFLGLPLAIYLIFVIYPFGQALYYSMTDWSGFTPTYNFVGLGNFTKLFHDDIFMLSLRNNVELAIVVPFVTIVLGLAIAMVVTVGGPTRGSIRGIRGSGFYRVVSFFPYTVPAIVIGLIWAQVYDPSAGHPQRLPHQDRPQRVRELRLARRRHVRRCRRPCS